MLRVLVLLVVCLAVSAAERRRFDRYHIYEVQVKGQQQAALIHQLEEDGLVDVGGSMKRGGGSVHLVVSPGHLVKVIPALIKNGMTPRLLDDDLQRRLDAEWEHLASRMDDAGQMDYDPQDYNDLQTCREELQRLARDCRDGFVCSYESIGQSVESRPIEVFTISRRGSDNPIVMLDATVHAREWISTTTAMKIINALVTSSESALTAILQNYDFHVVPIANPDGYSYSWTNDRLWRKNRAPDSCIGVDLNRNFATDNWGTEGVSHNPCSEIYCGPSPGSEPETVAMQDYALSFASGGSSRIITWITFHTYGWMWMFPWGHTENRRCAIPDDYDDLLQVADAAATAIRNHDDQNRRWDTGTSCEVIYETTGATDDWAKGKAGVKYAFNPELRGPWFEVSSTNIQPAFEETLAGVLAAVREIEVVEGKRK